MAHESPIAAQIGLRHEEGPDAAVQAWDPAGDVALWRLEYGQARPKPFVHPLRTRRGHVLTALEPADHPWHRGLWFTVKYVNGENFWEESDPPYGAQRVDAAPEVAEGHADTGATASMSVSWMRPDGVTRVLTEERVLATRLQDDRSYLLDWTTTLRSYETVLLERTPYAIQAPRDPRQWPGGPPFPAWGGYGGLMLRTHGDLEDIRFVLPDLEQPGPPPVGARAPWCAFLGRRFGEPVALAILDHVGNPRYPTPWYGGSNGRSLNAAVLFHEPMVLEPGAPVTLRYRLWIVDGHVQAPDVDVVAARFARESLEGGL